jgi:hypothetical protein
VPKQPLLALPIVYLGWAYLFWVPVLVSGSSVWALWHTPLVWFAGYYGKTMFHPQLSWWLPLIVCHTALIALVYNRTRCSLLAVLIFHGMMNFKGKPSSDLMYR